MSRENTFLRNAGVAGGTTAAVLGLLALKYPNRAVFSEEREGIPSLPGVPLLGSLPNALANQPVFYDWVCRQFELLDTLTMTSSSLGVGRRIITIDPQNVEHFLKHNFENYVKGPDFNDKMKDLFGHGIFNANGEQWRYQRKTASFMFNVKNFRDHFTDVFVKELKNVQRIFDASCQSGHAVDFHDVMYKFTLDSFVELGFGVHLNALGSDKKVPFAESFDICQTNASWRFMFPLWRISETAKSILMPWKMSIQDHLAVINKFAYDVIETRKEQIAQGLEFKDLLSRFMTTKDTTGEQPTTEGLRDIILNFIIAGRDTTAQALSWTFYNLMLHPRVQRKLLEEIDTYITDALESDSPALYEAIKNMTYAHAVFYEVLRLHPSVPGNLKFALQDDVWPDGTQVKAGDGVSWTTYAQGRSTKLWGPDAKEFRPERWIMPDGSLRRESQGQWAVFHAGPRVCLGQNLATLEALVAITYLLRRYNFTLAENQNVTYQVSLTMPMKEGMKVFVEPRA